jgi:sulfur relay (sulfurtransferase) complex TusBCD TusD component (DsrE family)
MKTLFILNAPPYGSEGSYNALRLAGTLVGRPDNEVKVFLKLRQVRAKGAGRFLQPPDHVEQDDPRCPRQCRCLRLLHGCAWHR